MAIENPWHDVSIGDKAPEVVNAIIEIPKDCQAKYELDKETGLLMLDRFMYSAVHYPGDYGFIPRTLWSDGDPLDVMILTARPVFPLTLAKIRVVGVLRMVDGDESDDKIIGVYDSDPRYKEFQSIKDIPKHILVELKHFFETYKQLQGKKVKILEILDRNEALKDIVKASEMYKMKFDVNGFEKEVISGN